MWRAQLDAETLLTALERLAAKQRHGKHPHAMLGDGLMLSSLADRAPAFTKELSRTLRRGEYRFGPVTRVRAWIDGKERVLYRACATDMVVHAALASELSKVLEPTFCDALYSYRVGRSAWQAIAHVVAFIARHRAEHSDVRSRGLYVVRRDVRSYGERIPVDVDSPLWSQLEAAIHPSPESWALLREAMAPRLAGQDGRVSSVPTGSALQPLMCNLYLSSVDEIGTSFAGALYVRVGDDILFAHTDGDVAREAASRIEAAVSELRLDLSPSKSLDVYFTGAGRASARWPIFRPASHIQYLGARIDFRGAIGLKAAHARQLMQRIDRRVRNAHDMVRDQPVGIRSGVVGHVVRCALDPSAPLCDPLASLLASAVTDRRQLKQLDYQVALRLAETLTGVRGPRAFRGVNYRTLRRVHGTPSLVVARHRRHSP